MTSHDQSVKQKSTGFVWLSERLDDLLRFFDLRARRTAGGWLDKRFKIQGHTSAALVLPAVLCGLLVLGSPDSLRWVEAVVTMLAVGLALLLLMRWSGRREKPSIRVDLAIQVVAVLLVCGFIWIVFPSTFQDGLPYRHMFVPIVAAVSISLLAGAALLGPLFNWPVSVSEYSGYLQRTELFQSRGHAAPFSSWTLLASSAAVAFRAPLALLTVPAIATLVVPPVWIPLVPLVVALLCVGAVLLAAFNDRFETMWLLLQEALSKGGASVVSVALVVLAALRLADVSYATTIFDSAAWWYLGIIFIAAYVISWWFDYWSHRMLVDQIMRLINGGHPGVATIPYDIDPKAVGTSVPTDERRLQIHGAARFIAIRDNPGRPPFFQAHLPMALIELLATCGAPGGKAVPAPGQIYARIAGYQAATSLVLAIVLGLGMWQLHEGPQDPEVVLQSTPEGLSLTKLLARRPADDAPVLVVAASGGGTRAAVYTAAILEGIARRGRAGNVVLGSGVSGGGAALAYFAGHREALVAEKADDAWNQYFDTMTQPFIQDVLQRSTEWRMVSSGRLGILLSESFQRRWNLPEARCRVDQVTDMGLIFNTSLAGHFARPKGAPTSGSLSAIEPDYRHLTTSALAGGRLVLTNLRFPAALASKPLEPDATLPQLPVTIRSPQLRLEEAAALNANFPPVFSNAAIDLDNSTRYWVTDGGAIDNRGMETLLYAVRLALLEIPKHQLPRLHIVVADASAFSPSFAQDRGISSMTGAGSRFASHLDTELVDAIRKTYADAQVPDRFKFSYVMMPNLLRQSGSFGTHWMLQDRIKVRHVEETVTLSGDEMIGVIRALHTGDTQRLSAPACQVLEWSREDKGHQDGWAGVLAAIGGTDPPPACKTK
jgi:hypothetical protein